MMTVEGRSKLREEQQSLMNYTSFEQESSESNHLNSEKGGCLARIYPAGFFPILKDVLKISLPLILQQMFVFSTSPIALMFCGHLGKIALDSVALANTMVNIFGISCAVGMCAACDTLFSQVFGSGDTLKMGVVLQRSFCILFLTLLVSLSILINTEAISLVLGQDPEVSRWTGRYILHVLPGVTFFFGYCCIMKFLQSQNRVVPTLVIGLVSMVTNVTSHYLLIYVAGLGIFGSAIAQSLTYFVMLLLGIFYIIFSGLYKTCWGGWSMQCLAAWGQFAYLGIAGLLMICIEWWSFEVAIIVAGLLGTTELGAQSVVFQIHIVVYMFPFGNGIATSILVGQYLGASNPVSAKTAARVGITFISLVGVMIAILLASLRDYLPRVFTSEADVLSWTSSILPVLGFCMLFDSVVGTSAGILRGCGRQTLGAVIVISGYTLALVIGIPLMFLPSLSVLGFWTGMAIALIILAVIESTIVYRMDWEVEAMNASKRVGAREMQSLIDETSSMDQESVCLIQDKEKKAKSDVQRDVCRSIFVTLCFLAVFIAAILIRLYVILPDKQNNVTELMTSHPIINATMATVTITNSYL